MAKIIGNKVVNTKEDNEFVEKWLKKQNKILIHIEETNESFFAPFATCNEKY